MAGRPSGTTMARAARAIARARDLARALPLDLTKDQVLDLALATLRDEFERDPNYRPVPKRVTKARGGTYTVVTINKFREGHRHQK